MSPAAQGLPPLAGRRTPARSTAGMATSGDPAEAAVAVAAAIAAGCDDEPVWT